MITGKKLKMARHIVGYTQEYLAQKLNVSQRTISKWEKEQVEINDVVADDYLNVLGKDKDWLSILDDKIVINQNNNTLSNDSQMTGYTYNMIESNELKDIIKELTELVKIQQEMIKKLSM